MRAPLAAWGGQALQGAGVLLLQCLAVELAVAPVALALLALCRRWGRSVTAAARCRVWTLLAALLLVLPPLLAVGLRPTPGQAADSGVYAAAPDNSLYNATSDDGLSRAAPGGGLYDVAPKDGLHAAPGGSPTHTPPYALLAPTPGDGPTAGGDRTQGDGPAPKDIPTQSNGTAWGDGPALPLPGETTPSRHGWQAALAAGRRQLRALGDRLAGGLRLTAALQALQGPLPVLVALWLAGAACLALGQAAHGVWWRLCCKRWAQPVPPQQLALYRQLCARLGLRHPPRLVCSGWVRGPVLAGLLRPVLLLSPADLAGGQTEGQARGQTEDQSEGQTQGLADGHLPLMLAHELQHHRRRDLWRLWLAWGAVLLHWWDPLAWLLAAAVRRSQELACDAAVLRLGGLHPGLADPGAPDGADPDALARRYADMLLQNAARGRASLLAVGLCSGHGRAKQQKKELKERMKQLFDTHKRRQAPALPLLLGCLVLGCALLAGCAVTAGQTPDADTPAAGLQVADGADPAGAADKTVSSDDGATDLGEADDAQASFGQTLPADNGLADDGPPSDGATPANGQTPAAQPDNASAQSICPVPGYAYISRGYVPEAHTGLDLAAAADSPIQAVEDGTVLEAGYDDERGNYLLLAHDRGCVLAQQLQTLADGQWQHDCALTTLYTHCSSLAVAEGDTVFAGDVVAYVGCTGNATGNQCHFELHCDGQPIDPALCGCFGADVTCYPGSHHHGGWGDGTGAGGSADSGSTGGTSTGWGGHHPEDGHHGGHHG